VTRRAYGIALWTLTAIGAGAAPATAVTPASARPAAVVRSTPPVPPELDPFALPDRPEHGNPRSLVWGGHGELRFGHDRVRGVSNPEWFSVNRANGFASARLHPRWRVTGEGTWDRGTDDFVLERAELSFRWKPSLAAHAGIFPVPLGRTNLSHDAPTYPFAEHSLVATQLIGVPNAMPGLGVRGVRNANTPWTYEVDLVSGFGDGPVMDAPGGTRLPMGRSNYEDRNGIPALVGRVAWHPGAGADWGLGALTGPYNETRIGGETVDRLRWVHLAVADGRTTWRGVQLAGEAAVAWIDVPPGLRGLYAIHQWGAAVEASRTLVRPVFGSPALSLSAALRADAVDLDRSLSGDSRHRVSASVNLRRHPRGIVRLGWYYEIRRDRFDNETPHAGLTLTTGTYF
jgi:hypothetical protein